jgi:hypothetical protein
MTDNSALEQLLRALVGYAPQPSLQPAPQIDAASVSAMLKSAGGAKKSDIEKLLEQISAAKQPGLPSWATRQPVDTTELLRQLSGNVGQMPMPGGPVGSVVTPAWGSGGQAQVGFDPRTYGQTGGEATFFQQSMRGGMTPISAISPLGSGQGWDPFNTGSAANAADKKEKKFSRVNIVN